MKKMSEQSFEESWYGAIDEAAEEERNEFNPLESGRVSRAEGYYFTGFRLRRLLQRRGDERVGQLILNALRHGDMYKDSIEAQAQALWDVELPQLCDEIETYLDEVVEDR